MRLSLLSTGAIVALVLAIAFTTHQSFRFAAATRELSAARVEKARTRLLRPAAISAPAPAGPSVAATAPAVSPSFVERLNELKKRAVGRAPGGVPLINVEELFDYHAPLRQAYLDAVKGQQWVEYGPFFANAGLSPAEIEQFYAIAMEREMAWLEMRKIHPGPSKDNPGPEKPEARAMNEQAERERKAKLAALLGEERFQQLTRYEEEIDARTMLLGLRHLVATSFYTDEPITVAQMNQLTALAVEFGMFHLRKANGIPDAFDQLAVRAARILSPAQLEVFDLMLDHQQYTLAQWQLHFPEETKPKKVTP